MSTVAPGQFVNALGQSYGPDSVFPPVYLTGAILSANAPNFPTLTFPAYNSLRVEIWITGYGGSDVVSLRFNADSGTNYCDRTITVAQGGVVLTNTETASTTLIRMGLPVAVGRTVVFTVGNTLARNKVGQVLNQFGSANAATPPIATLSAGGIWFNTAAQITQIDALTAGGANLLVGSSIQIFGGL